MAQEQIKLTLDKETLEALDAVRGTIPRATYAGNIIWKTLVEEKNNNIYHFW